MDVSHGRPKGSKAEVLYGRLEARKLQSSLGDHYFDFDHAHGGIVPSGYGSLISAANQPRAAEVALAAKHSLAKGAIRLDHLAIKKFYSELLKSFEADYRKKGIHQQTDVNFIDLLQGERTALGAVKWINLHAHRLYEILNEEVEKPKKLHLRFMVGGDSWRKAEVLANSRLSGFELPRSSVDVTISLLPSASALNPTLKDLELYYRGRKQKSFIDVETCLNSAQEDYSLRLRRSYSLADVKTKLPDRRAFIDLMRLLEGDRVQGPKISHLEFFAQDRAFLTEPALWKPNILREFRINRCLSCGAISKFSPSERTKDSKFLDGELRSICERLATCSPERCDGYGENARRNSYGEYYLGSKGGKRDQSFAKRKPLNPI